MIKSKCSNCGKTGYYKKIKMFREMTICKFCNHPLSVCSWFVGY